MAICAIRRAVFTGTSIPQRTSSEERARSMEARARMIERGGYGFGERAAALLGSAGTADTLALAQQTLRATNPAGFMQAARFIAEAEMPPSRPVIGKTLRDAGTERVANDVEPIDPERRQQVIERIGIIAAARCFGPQIVA